MDPIQTFETYKDKIGERLTRKLISAVGEKKISEEQLSEISSYILDNIDKAKNNSDLFDFLEHISQKWPLFSDVLNVEEAEIKEGNKEEKVDRIENLIDQNKIDEAIKIAAEANKPTQGGND